MDSINGREIVELKNQIESRFNKSDWLDFSYTLDCYDIIESHSRLLRSLDFGDDDYAGNILQVLTSIIKRDNNNLNRIRTYLAEKYATPEVSNFVSTAHTEIPKRMITFAPQAFQVPDMVLKIRTRNCLNFVYHEPIPTTKTKVYRRV